MQARSDDGVYGGYLRCYDFCDIASRGEAGRVRSASSVVLELEPEQGLEPGLELVLVEEPLVGVLEEQPDRVEG